MCLCVDLQCVSVCVCACLYTCGGDICVHMCVCICMCVCVLCVHSISKVSSDPSQIEQCVVYWNTNQGADIFQHHVML